MINKLYLARTYLKDCTKGVLEVGKHVLYTIEEPWRDNKNGISCIPEGLYNFVPHNWGPKYNPKLKQRDCYRLEGTGHRKGVLIHIGNTVMDIEGCIVPGLRFGKLAGMEAVLQSGAAMEELRKLVGNNPGTIEIRAAK